MPRASKRFRIFSTARATPRWVRGVQSRIMTLLRERFGHDFSTHKDQPFMRRVLRRMRLLNMPDLPAYADILTAMPTSRPGYFEIF